MWDLVIILGGFVAFMYMFIIRPQMQRRREMLELMGSLTAGDEIVMIAGLHGTVTRVDDTTVTLRVAEGVEVVYEKDAIGRRLAPVDGEGAREAGPPQ